MAILKLRAAVVLFSLLIVPTVSGPQPSPSPYPLCEEGNYAPLYYAGEGSCRTVCDSEGLPCLEAYAFDAEELEAQMGSPCAPLVRNKLPTVSRFKCQGGSDACAPMCPTEGETLDCDYTEARNGIELLCACAYCDSESPSPSPYSAPLFSSERDVFCAVGEDAVWATVVNWDEKCVANEALDTSWSGLGVYSSAPVVDLSLSNEVLSSGTLPVEFSALTGLTSLYVISSSLGGTLPPEYSTLTDLGSIVLYGNQLTGSVPPSYSALTGLTEFRVYDNTGLTGCLPSNIASITGDYYGVFDFLDYSGTGITGACT